MLLERLLDALDVAVKPLAVCDIRRDWAVEMPAEPGVTSVHFVVSGDGRIHAPNGYAADFGPDSLILVPQGVRHRIGLRDGASHILGAAAECSREHGVRRLNAGSEGANVLVICGAIRVAYAGAVDVFAELREPLTLRMAREPVGAAFRMMLEEQAQMGPGSSTLLSSWMLQCLVAVFRRLCETQECRLPWLAGLEDPRLGRAITAMLDTPGDSHSLASLAAVAGMSRSSFAEHFRRAFAAPPMEYLREIRLRKAAAMLRVTQESVAAIAEKVGFSSRSHFSTAFRAAYQTDPAAYRRSSG